MSRRITSKIESTHDRRMFKHLADVAAFYQRQGTKFPSDALLDYIRAARRSGWSFDLISQALGISSSQVRRRYRDWQSTYD